MTPNNFCFYNIAKKSFPGTPLGQVPDLAVQGAWTSPRWSWTSGDNFKPLFSSSTLTSVSTKLSKSHSLGHPLVMPYSCLSEVLDLTQKVMVIWEQQKMAFSS